MKKEENGISAEATPATLGIVITGEGINISHEITIDMLPQLLAIIVRGKGEAPQSTQRFSADGSESGHGPLPQGRRLSIVEYIDEKEPETGAETILVLSRYAETYEGIETVTRTDIKRLYKQARIPAPANLSRDVGTCVQKGYLLEHAPGIFQVTKKGTDILKNEGAGMFGRRGSE